MKKVLFAGVDAASLDTRIFNVSRTDIETLCRFFALGKVQKFEQEKNTAVSHSNFFVFVKTSKGQFALKFFPGDSDKLIAVEYAINRFLTDEHFPTPAMHIGRNRKPYLPCNGRLATCFNFIDGKPGWENVTLLKIRQMNATMRALKPILRCAPVNIPRIKQSNFTTTVTALTKTSKSLGYYDDKAVIDGALQQACRIYQQHSSLFTRHWLHNNVTLTNFIFQGETLYTLDLSHIREDYVVSDLAALVISFVLLDIAKDKIPVLIKDHFTQHGLKNEHLIVLDVLLKIGLIKEYLKTLEREQALPVSKHSPQLKNTYQRYIKERKSTIIKLLKN
jgi:Ser/Thr protein kinase RdoA (MazF antagonist)